MTGQVVYLAPDFAKPSGGVRAMYRHAEVAREAGIDAKIWHHADDFTCEWFSTSATVVSGAKLELGPEDLLVVPEVMVLPGFDPAPGCRKVVYNQNHFYTFDNWSGDDYPSWDPAPSVWTTSAVSVAVLRRLHPHLTVEQVPYMIDTGLFRFARDRGRKVVWMPRKRPREAALLMALFRADPRFAGVELVAVDDVSEQRTAEVLADASVFVALGHEEGFGLPVAEALAAGCVVVGYPAGGGAELFAAPGTHAVDDCDVLTIVDRVAEVLAAEPSTEERRTYRAWVEENYSEAGLLSRLRTVIESALETPTSGGTAKHPLAELGERTGERTEDDAAQQLARSLRFADEQRRAREHAESIATGLEESFGRALSELDESRRGENILRQELADLRQEYTALSTAAERLTVLDETAVLLAEYTRDNDRLGHRLDEEIRRREAELLHVRTTLQDRIDELERSTSWRVTAPLRRAKTAIRGEHDA